jgi:hypothetical protein
MIKRLIRFILMLFFLSLGWTARGYWIAVEAQVSEVQTAIETLKTVQGVFDHE